jgi:predicted signal transduction protein with EAL and GGDEF domain
MLAIRARHRRQLKNSTLPSPACLRVTLRRRHRRHDLALRAHADPVRHVRQRSEFHDVAKPTNAQSSAPLSMRLRRLRAGFEAGQLQLYCPPQVSHGKVYGVEALLRCKHARRCMVAPSVFVPIAEQSGLIEALGLVTLRQAVALRQAFEDSHRLASLRLASLRLASLRLASLRLARSAAQRRLKDFALKLKSAL